MPIDKAKVTWLKHIDISDDSAPGYGLAAMAWIQKDSDDGNAPAPVISASRTSASPQQLSRTTTVNIPPGLGLRCYISSLTETTGDDALSLYPSIKDNAPETKCAPCVNVQLLTLFFKEKQVPNANTMLYLFFNREHKEKERSLYIRVIYRDAGGKKEELETSVVTYSFNLEHARDVGMECYLQFLFTFGYAPSDVVGETLFGITREDDDGNFKELSNDVQPDAFGETRVMRFLETQPHYPLVPPEEEDKQDEDDDNSEDNEDDGTGEETREETSEKSDEDTGGSSGAEVVIPGQSTDATVEQETEMISEVDEGETVTDGEEDDDESVVEEIRDEDGATEILEDEEDVEELLPDGQKDDGHEGEEDEGDLHDDVIGDDEQDHY